MGIYHLVGRNAGGLFESIDVLGVDSKETALGFEGAKELVGLAGLVWCGGIEYLRCEFVEWFWILLEKFQIEEFLRRRQS